jgi:hypothetical protein
LYTVQDTDTAPPDGDDNSEEIGILGAVPLLDDEFTRRTMQPLAERFADIIQPYTAEMTKPLAAQMSSLVEEFTQGPSGHLTAIREALGTPPWPQQLVESFQPLIASWSESMAPVLERLRTLGDAQLPDNWRDAELDGDKFEEILVSDGIPLGWVPRAEIVSTLMRCSTRQERITVLMEARDLVRFDCQECLDPIDDQDLSEWVGLARKAIAAWEAGHDEAAQALATVTAEGVITRRIARPVRAVEMATSSWETPPTLGRAKLAIALGPLIGFYEKWYPSEGRPPLPTLSRHVTVHHPSAVQVNPENCVLAIMLLCSILRAIHEVALDRRGEAA